MATVRDILKVKGSRVHTIGPHATVLEAAALMNEHKIGSLVVMSDEQVIGIITERDILKAHAANRVPLGELPLARFMTGKLVTANPDDDITVAMGLMTEHRIRHLPVVEAGQLFGLVSIGDVVKAQHDELIMENHHMRSYIQGGGSVATPLD